MIVKQVSIQIRKVYLEKCLLYKIRQINQVVLNSIMKTVYWLLIMKKETLVLLWKKPNSLIRPGCKDNMEININS